MSILDCLEQKPMGPWGLSDNWLSKWFPSYFQPLKNCVRFNPFFVCSKYYSWLSNSRLYFQAKESSILQQQYLCNCHVFVAKNRIVNFTAFFYHKVCVCCTIINQNRLNLATAKVSSQGSHVIYFFDRTFLLQNVKRFLPWNGPVY